MLVGLNQASFPGVSTSEFMDIAARAGAENVSLHPYRGSETHAEIIAQARAGGVRVAAVDELMDWALPDDPYPHPAFESLIELAKSVGAPLLVCVAPLRREGLPPPSTVMRSAAERLSLLAETARSHGISLALEQVGRSSTRPDVRSGIRSLANALTIVEQAADDVLLVLDAFNIATADDGFDQMRKLPARRIGIAHINDADAQLLSRVSLGEGVLDLPGFVQALHSRGYEGSLSLELFPSAPWPDPYAEAAKAVQAIVQLLAAAA